MWKGFRFNGHGRQGFLPGCFAHLLSFICCKDLIFFWFKNRKSAKISRCQQSEIATASLGQRVDVVFCAFRNSRRGVSLEMLSSKLIKSLLALVTFWEPLYRKTLWVWCLSCTLGTWFSPSLINQKWHHQSKHCHRVVKLKSASRKSSLYSVSYACFRLFLLTES